MVFVLTCKEYDGGFKTFVKQSKEECIQEVIEWMALDDNDAAQIRKSLEETNEYDCGHVWKIEQK